MDARQLTRSASMAPSEDREFETQSVRTASSTLFERSTLSPASAMSTITPEPAYVSVPAAISIVAGDLAGEFSQRQDTDGNESSNSVIVSPSSLTLLNAFLDRLLHSILSSAKSTSISALRVAIFDVLKSRLATMAVADADEELGEYLSADENELQDVKTTEPSPDWDLDLAWKRARLRCMLYTRLGDFDEQDLELYYEQYHLGVFDEEEDANSVSPAVAIFLTSILEFVGEHVLLVAGQAGFKRAQALGRKLNRPASMALTVQVEDTDMEKLAFDPTFGRLWRAWKKTVRMPSSHFGRTQSIDATKLTQPPSVVEETEKPSLDHEKEAEKAKTEGGEEAQTQAEGEVPDIEGKEEELLPESVPLPTTIYDDHEIEVPNFSHDLARHVETARATYSRRPISVVDHLDLLRQSRAKKSEPEVDLVSIAPRMITRARSHSPVRRIDPVVHEEVPTKPIVAGEAKEVQDETVPVENGTQEQEQTGEQLPSTRYSKASMHTPDLAAEALQFNKSDYAIDRDSFPRGSPRRREDAIRHDSLGMRASTQGPMETYIPEMGIMPEADIPTKAGEQQGQVKHQRQHSDTFYSTTSEYESQAGQREKDAGPNPLDLVSPIEESPTTEYNHPLKRKDTGQSEHEIQQNARVYNGHVDGQGARAALPVEVAASQTDPVQNREAFVFNDDMPISLTRRTSVTSSMAEGTMSVPWSGTHSYSQSREDAYYPVPPLPSQHHGYHMTTDQKVALAGASTLAGAAMLDREQNHYPLKLETRSKSTQATAQAVHFTPVGRNKSFEGSKDITAQITQIPSPAARSNGRMRNDSAKSSGSTNEREAQGSTSAESPSQKHFQELIESGQTKQYTLTPQAARQTRIYEMPEAMHMDPREDPDDDEYDPYRSPPATGAVLRKISSGSLRNRPQFDRNQSIDGNSKRLEPMPVVRKPVTQPQQPRSPTKTTVSALQPRDARVQNNGSRDLAEWLKTTGPENGPTPVTPQWVKPGRAQTDKSTDSREPATKKAKGPVPRPSKILAAQALASPTASISGQSQGSPALASGIRPKRTTAGFKDKLQPRDAVVRSDTSALIDLIRQGPPGDRPVGSHRIPRTIAPFRTTMDSDDLNGGEHTGNGRMMNNAPNNHSFESNNGSSLSGRGQSVNSKTALLENNNLRNASSGMAMPPRKTNRVKDPYSIEAAENIEEEDDEQAGPGESLLDFLNSVPPPTQNNTHRPVPISKDSPRSVKPSRQPSIRTSPTAHELPADIPSKFLGHSALASSGRSPRQPIGSPVLSKSSSGIAIETTVTRSVMSISDLRTAAQAQMQGQMQGQPKKKLQARDPQGIDKFSSTNDLADFLRNSGPPDEFVGGGTGSGSGSGYGNGYGKAFAPSVTSSTVGGSILRKSGGLSRLFSRNKR